MHTSTVSRVLRQTEPVDGWSEAAQRIREVADELGYRPNLGREPAHPPHHDHRRGDAASHRRSGRDHLPRRRIDGPQVGILGAAQSPDEPDEQAEAIALLAGRQVDGLLVSSLHSPAAEFVAGLGLSVPMVALNRHADSGLPYAVGDDHLGGYLAGRHLLDCGYRRPAVIGGPLHATTGRDRLAGFLDAMSESGAEPPPQHITHAGFDVQGGIEAAHRLLELPDRPDAIFAVSDAIAIGVVGVARDLGIRVPDELGLVGYNDIPVVSQLPVPLTTIVTPAEEIGAAGVRLLLDLIANPDAEPENITLPVELVVRASTGWQWRDVVGA